MLVSTASAEASEGTIELSSTTGENYRCFANSVLMPDQKYTILMSCRDLIYPVDGGVYVYALWANPASGGNPVHLGPLDIGKKEFRSDVSFSSLFVTTENPGYRTPAGRVVMRGNVHPVDFLDNPSVVISQPAEESSVTPTPYPNTNLSAKDRLLLGLRRAGIVALIALVALIGLIFVITRSRG